MDYGVVYLIAKECINNKMTRDEAAEEIYNRTGMNISTAKIHIADLIDMYKGNMYSRTISAAATKVFIEGLKTDYGDFAFKNALFATEEHVKYFNKIGVGKRNSIANLLKKY